MLLLQRIMRLAAPDLCVICASEGALVCDQCIPALGGHKEPTCWRCNRISSGGRTCSSCRSSSAISGVTIGAHYEGQVKTLIWRLKYQRQRDAAKALAALLTPLLREDKHFDFVTFVPASARHFRQRGFDQSKLLAIQIGHTLGLPVLKVLGRSGAQKQVGLDRRQRTAQVVNSFYPVRSRVVPGSRVLLVDDVITTGATLNQCARVLKEKGGAQSVWCAVVARG